MRLKTVFRQITGDGQTTLQLRCWRARVFLTGNLAGSFLDNIPLGHLQSTSTVHIYGGGCEKSNSLDINWTFQTTAAAIVVVAVETWEE